jgi:hypothetical protein
MSQTTETQHKKAAKGPQIYLAPEITVDDELSRLKKIVYLFSCHRKMTGASSSILREKLIILVSLYLKYGYNDEAKDKAAEILSVKRPAINSMNLELRSANYLRKDPMNTRINHLHDDLEKLRTYVGNTGDGSLFFMVKISNG